jgi:hypothetical protein
MASFGTTENVLISGYFCSFVVLIYRSLKMGDFAERSGVARCTTPWGSWWQTIDEVGVDVSVPGLERARDVAVSISANHLKVAKRDGPVIVEVPDLYTGQSCIIISTGITCWTDRI